MSDFNKRVLRKIDTPWRNQVIGNSFLLQKFC